MPNAQRTPVVPLEAGAGPENPPCPACGEPLFGWLSPQQGLDGPVSRCESCGLGVVGADAGPEEALRELDRLGGERRNADRQPRQLRLPRSAAPAGPAWSPAPATSSRSRRCDASSPAATRW